MRRINQALDKDSIIEALSSGDGAIFPNKWSLFMFAAVLGFKHGCREKLTKADQGKAIRTELFANNDMCFNGVLNLMTLLEMEDERILVSNEQNDDLKVRIFEEYINGGLSILESKLESSSYSLDSIVAFVAEEIFKGKVEPSEIKIEI